MMAAALGDRRRGRPPAGARRPEGARLSRPEAAPLAAGSPDEAPRADPCAAAMLCDHAAQPS